MNILYLSVHEILACDEISLLLGSGHRIFTIQSLNGGPLAGGILRPPLPAGPLEAEWIKIGAGSTPEHLPEALVERMDAVIVMHEPRYLLKNWGLLRNKRVIWRTIGQSTWPIEDALRGLREEGLQIVRSSPTEARIPRYIGSDALIRFGKSPEEYTGWTGESAEVINFTQHLTQRFTHCNGDVLETIAGKFPFTLYGPGNGDVPYAKGPLSHENQKRVLRSARAYVFTGTHPASYTLGFIEAWMTGIPVVAVGPERGNPRRSGYKQDTYEVPDFLQDGINGYCRDNLNDLVEALRRLMQDPAHAAAVGRAGRQRAIELFGWDFIQVQWKQFLES